MFSLNFNSRIWQRFVMATGAAVVLLSMSQQAMAESGFYLGGSVGSTTISADVPDGSGGEFAFDENDFSWKAFGGYNFGLAVIDLGIEAGYVDLGGPSTTLLGEEVGLELAGWDVFGLAGVQLGPIGVFAKAGYFTWDVDALIAGQVAGTDDGSDPAYGVGAKFALGSVQVRGEYEYFDVDGSSDVYMLSVGLVWSF
jgi:outer membrane immunogenic protein